MFIFITSKFSVPFTVMALGGVSEQRDAPCLQFFALGSITVIYILDIVCMQSWPHDSQPPLRSGRSFQAAKRTATSCTRGRSYCCSSANFYYCFLVICLSGYYNHARLCCHLFTGAPSRRLAKLLINASDWARRLVLAITDPEKASERHLCCHLWRATLVFKRWEAGKRNRVWEWRI